MVIGINEGGMWREQIERAAARLGFVAYGTRGSRRTKRANPVLVSDDIPVTDWKNRQLCKAVGDSPERTWTEVFLDFEGWPVAVLNVHANSHVQEGPANPHELPRVGEYIRGGRRLTRRVKTLRAAGYRVIVLGDLNWSWSNRVVQWFWSPVKVFGRLGMVTQYDVGKQLARPKGDSRRIEYVAWVRDEWEYDGQSFITPERSDHPFHRVDLTIKPGG